MSMTFKELKSGFTIHILDKEKYDYRTEKVNNVSMPHIDAKISSVQMVVDVMTECGTYCMVADSDVAYPSNKVIATDIGIILREVEACKGMAEQALSQVEKHNRTVEKCNSLLSDLDPVRRDKMRNEERFKGIEESIGDIKTMLKELMK